jgi:hypothetical protein
MHDAAFGIFHGVEPYTGFCSRKTGLWTSGVLHSTILYFGASVRSGIMILVRWYRRWWTALIINFGETRRVMELMELRVDARTVRNKQIISIWDHVVLND